MNIRLVNGISNILRTMIRFEVDVELESFLSKYSIPVGELQSTGAIQDECWEDNDGEWHQSKFNWIRAFVEKRQ